MTSEILAERVARNQSLFREQNEWIAPSNSMHRAVSPLYADWICECATEACSVLVQLTVAEYETVRSDPTHFLVAPNEAHVAAGVESVVRRNERYWIVEKVGRAGEVSEKFDPRSREPVA